MRIIPFVISTVVTAGLVFALNKKWGTSKTLGNQAIYANKGFDTENERFNYGVNTAGVVTPSGNPFQGQIGVRYSF